MQGRMNNFNAMKSGLIELSKAYQDNYTIFKNSHDALAKFVISKLENFQPNNDSRFTNLKEKEWQGFPSTMIKLLVIALQLHLRQENSNKYLSALNSFIGQYEIEKERKSLLADYSEPFGEMVLSFKETKKTEPRKFHFFVDGLMVFLKNYAKVNKLVFNENALSQQPSVQIQPR